MTVHWQLQRLAVLKLVFFQPFFVKEKDQLYPLLCLEKTLAHPCPSCENELTKMPWFLLWLPNHFLPHINIHQNCCQALTLSEERRITFGLSLVIIHP
jgi:hypothetical protein